MRSIKFARLARRAGFAAITESEAILTRLMIKPQRRSRSSALMPEYSLKLALTG
jgi:hypothetical protein